VTADLRALRLEGQANFSVGSSLDIWSALICRAGRCGGRILHDSRCWWSIWPAGALKEKLSMTVYK